MKSNTSMIGSANIEYRWIGKETGRGGLCFVFLHEGLGCMRMWRDFPDQLVASVGLPGFVYSRQGYGGSSSVTLPRPVDYMQQEALERMVEIFDHFDIRDAILFGHSDGGSIALAAAAGPLAGRIRGLVALAPHVVIEDVTTSSIAELARDYREGNLRDRLAKYHGANVDCAFWGFAGTWLHEGNAAAWSLVPFLPRISCPALVLQGKDDAFGTQIQLDLIRDNIAGPCEALMLAGCGHWPHAEVPQEVIRHTLAFVESICTTGKSSSDASTALAD